MMTLAKIMRYGRTVRHLKPSQIAWRLRYSLRKAVARTRGPTVTETPAFDPLTLHALREFLRAYAQHRCDWAEEVEEFLKFRLSVLNTTIDVGTEIPWALPGESRLARYTLHYMDFLRFTALASAESPRPEHGDVALNSMASWAGSNPAGTGMGWDAFPTSARLINWCLLISVFPGAPDDVVNSLAMQTAHLTRNIEHDVLANHILKNALALTVAGKVLGADSPLGAKALGIGLPLVRTQLGEQILADGGHYERSPMYHCQVLEDCLIAFAALHDEAETEWLSEAIHRMAGFLMRVIHTDGQIPLFGDAVIDPHRAPTALLETASQTCGFEPPLSFPACYALEPSGIYVMTAVNADARMTLKAGPPGPAYQLGHAHCDMSSFELALGTKRAIVDSGVWEYEAGPMRDYCRSTRAHNTVRVAGREQLECWNAFRVGRRYRPHAIQWSEAPPSPRLRASHDGFKPYGHERLVVLHEGRFWVVIDTVTGPGTFAAESYLHFHPEFELTQIDAGWEASSGDSSVTIAGFGISSWDHVRGVEAPCQGWYCPEFGKRVAASTLVLRVRADGRCRFGYAIFPRASDVISTADLGRLVDAIAGKL